MKKSLNLLQELVRKCAKLWDDQMAITASVIIQNMAAHANEWKWEQFNPHLEILKGMKGLRPDNHVIAWAYSETKMIVDGHFMSLDFDEKKELSVEANETFKYEQLVLGVVYATDKEEGNTFIFRHTLRQRCDWLHIIRGTKFHFMKQGLANFAPINGFIKFRSPTMKEFAMFADKEEETSFPNCLK